MRRLREVFECELVRRRGLLARAAAVDWLVAYFRRVPPPPHGPAVAGDLVRAAGRHAEAELASAGAADADIKWYLGAEMRYAGQGHNVAVTLPWMRIGKATVAPLLAEFEKRYRQLYGHLVPNALPQVITWRLTGRSLVKSHRFTWGDERARSKAVMRGRREIFLPLRKKFAPVPVYERYSLEPGTRIAGPVILEERESTLVAGPDCRLRVDRYLNLIVDIEAPGADR